MSTGERYQDNLKDWRHIEKTYSKNLCTFQFHYCSELIIFLGYPWNWYIIGVGFVSYSYMILLIQSSGCGNIKYYVNVRIFMVKYESRKKLMKRVLINVHLILNNLHWHPYLVYSNSCFPHSFIYSYPTNKSGWKC